MGKYNHGLKYNFKSFDNGLTYNYLGAFILIKVNDSIKISESLETSQRAFIRETANILDDLSPMLISNVVDSAFIGDEAAFVNFIEIFESLNITDKVTDLLMSASVYENRNIITDYVMPFANILIEENVSISENLTLEALIELAERFELKEMHDALRMVMVNEDLTIMDRTPRKAVSDMIVETGYAAGFEGRFFEPLGMMVNENQTSKTYMPTAEHEYVNIPGNDGDLMQNTVYKNRTFQFSLYSLKGLTKSEQQELAKDITQLLDNMKKESKTITFADDDITFEAKYTGQATFGKGLDWVKTNFSLETSPYGKKLFPTEFSGNGIIVNDGDKDLGATVKITGPCSSPNFTIGEKEFLYNTAVPSNKTLVIDNEDMTCYLINEWGVKENALQYLVKGYDFYVVPKNYEANVTALNEETQAKMTVEYNPSILWLGR